MQDQDGGHTWYMALLLFYEPVLPESMVDGFCFTNQQPFILLWRERTPFSLSGESLWM